VNNVNCVRHINLILAYKKSHISVGFNFVGDIDLSSNQMLEFLEFFNNEKE
jgi:hypothetical protein